MPTCHFSAYLKGPFFSPSHSPFSPAFSKKPSRPLAWTPRTFLRIVSDGVVPHTHISQGFLTTSSSCTGTCAQALINFICYCLWPRALVSQMLWPPYSSIQCSPVITLFSPLFLFYVLVIIFITTIFLSISFGPFFNILIWGF